MSKKLATDWDALIASAPANAQAARDAGARGAGWTPAKTLHREWDQRSDLPLPMKPVTYGKGSIDLRGYKCGRLTVLGLHDSKRRGNAAWVVRCVCGAYETRTAKALRNPEYIARIPCCRECDYVRHLREGTAVVPGMKPIDLQKVSGRNTG